MRKTKELDLESYYKLLQDRKVSLYGEERGLYYDPDEYYYELRDDGTILFREWNDCYHNPGIKGYDNFHISELKVRVKAKRIQND